MNSLKEPKQIFAFCVFSDYSKKPEHSASSLINTQPQQTQLTHLPLDKMAAILADDIFKCTLVNENYRILIPTSLKFVPDGPIDNYPALV